jgi:hypothetical protein
MGKRLFYIRYNEVRTVQVEKHVYADDEADARARRGDSEGEPHIELIDSKVTRVEVKEPSFLVEDTDRDFDAEAMQRRSDEQNGVGKW